MGFDRAMTESELDACGLPRELHQVVFQDVLGNSLAKDRLKKYVNSFDNMFSRGFGLFLFGPPLSGKSMLAGIAAKCVLARHKRLFWSNLTKVTSHMFQPSTARPNEGNDPPFLDRCTQSDVFVLDGLEKTELAENARYIVNDGMRASFNEVVQARSKAKLPTIITSRFQLEGPENSIESAFGLSLAHLIRSKYVMIECRENPRALERMAEDVEAALEGEDQ